ncbi:ATP-binding cassette domain-containing protein [Thermodesulforhabdus norvegica]|uniref:Tungstate transport system ATP-binding protein n=1 Tax=Thermodesulforhabdus norvegica TaxID=39841 RepID=A0A1I4SES2_9BACT|nr:ATP-binding cassette domain-containing protein [Thermodesulforhabdus norvegica]SFM62820.1 tungstate transport system ATP-binding protein [Thermodesulforhabdus norvegica]
MEKPIYRLEGIRHRYGNRTVLRIDVLEIHKGEIIGLVGPNGSGKSTLLRLLAFIENPSAGRLLYFSEGRKPHFEVTLLTQEPYLLKRDVFGNVGYGLRVRGERANLQRRVEEALEWVGLDPAAFIRRKWYELSGGEAQRVALAARLVLRPRVLLLDEPTANVDAESARRIQEAAIKAQERWGTTIVVSSHDWWWLLNLCDRVVHLFEGQALGSGVGNLIFGPWKKIGDNLWKRTLSNGQAIICPNVPGENAIGWIEPEGIRIGLIENGKKGDANSGTRVIELQGRVANLAAYGKKNHLVATVWVGEERFLSLINPEDTVVVPGQEVCISIDAGRIRWLDRN